MGTRGIFGFRIDGQDKLTYNHFDSYPSGLGMTMVGFLREHTRTPAQCEVLAEQVRALRLVNEDDKPTPAEMGQLREYADSTVGTQSPGDWYCLLRKCQGEPEQVLKSGVMIDSHTFVNDSLFCEWAYVVNLDEGTLEVYRGFQTEKGAGRYAKQGRKPRNWKPRWVGESFYYPVALVATFLLNGPIDLSALQAMDSE